MLPQVRLMFITNLPNQITSFIGREAQIAELKQLLLQKSLPSEDIQDVKSIQTRLLTITGTGGTGKTRLAFELASQLKAYFTDGILLVELASLDNPDLLPFLIAQNLNLAEEPSVTLLQTLISHLRDKKLLLLLDNCEHLVLACARLSSLLLKACSQITILITSREILGISGEMAWRIPSLTL